MTAYPIPDLAPGDVVYLPIDPDGTTQGPITVEWVREEQDGTTYVGWHAGGEDHVLCLPLDLGGARCGSGGSAPCRYRDRRARAARRPGCGSCTTRARVMTTAAPTRRPEADTEEVGRRPSRERAVPSAVRCEDLLPVTTVSTVAVDDGVALRVEEVGEPSAPMTVVFVHGFCLHMGSWYFQRQDLPDCTDARLVFYDQRSHGRSGRSSTGQCTIDQLDRDLAAVLRTVAPTGPVVLVGHSMGGMTIMALARQCPELFATRVAGVALISTAAAGLMPAVLRLGAHHPG